MIQKLSADDDQLARRIATAFDGLEAPEATHLDAIEDRLARALPSKPQIRRAPVWYWWLIGALAVSGAAAWWVGEYLVTDTIENTPRQTEPARTDESPRDDAAAPADASGRAADSASGEAPADSGRTILRRERY